MAESKLGKMKNYVQSSTTLKLIIISILTLILLIPTGMIKSIIQEREMLNVSATNEVSDKWSKSQIIKGPILTIPVTYKYEEEVDDKKEIKFVTKNHHFLPNDLQINGEITPEKLNRGIYEIAVYASAMKIDGSFDCIFELSDPSIANIQYENSFISIGISDLRGIENDIEFSFNDEKLSRTSESTNSNIRSGLSYKIPDLKSLLDQKVKFDFNLNLQGSKNLSFVPVGKTTEVNISSNWNSPSFVGNFLPDQREITEEGFSANWKILEFNRNIPSTWIDFVDQHVFGKSMFGIDLIIPLDDYQKSMRSAKYALMIIALTFLIFFLVEIMNKRLIHPLQYSLVGLALCLFYILLVSISEHMPFNFAYFVSALGIISMIGLYSLSVFKLKKYSLVLVACLSGIYTFLFVTIQMVDFALLFGSIGLTAILAMTMYFTRNINWYKIELNAST